MWLCKQGTTSGRLTVCLEYSVAVLKKGSNDLYNITFTFCSAVMYLLIAPNVVINSLTLRVFSYNKTRLRRTIIWQTLHREDHLSRCQVHCKDVISDTKNFTFQKSEFPVNSFRDLNFIFIYQWTYALLNKHDIIYWRTMIDCFRLN